MFYIFFEVSIIPVVLIIFGWGYQPERLRSGFYMFFYTLFASFPLLISLIFLDFNFGRLRFFVIWKFSDKVISFFLVFAFLVKFPLMFFHSWLPRAHVEAPAGGSMILAGVILKLGGYGLIRLVDYVLIYIFSFRWFYLRISLYRFFYFSVVCLFQSDLRIIIAYSSVSHMSLVIGGLFSLTSLGFYGSLILIVGHGLVSSGMFYLVGLIYIRYSSRRFFVVRGLISCYPSFGLMGFLMFAGNISFPPSLSLISEVLIFCSFFSWRIFLILFIFFGLFFSACYRIFLYSFIFHGFSRSLIGGYEFKLYEILIIF